MREVSFELKHLYPARLPVLTISDEQHLFKPLPLLVVLPIRLLPVLLDPLSSFLIL
jgi:hypothetical protein